MSVIHPQQLNSIIQEDIEASGALLKLLEAEQQALKKRLHRDLENLLREKNTLIHTLDANAEKRQQILAQATMTGTAESWQKLLVLINNQKLIDDWETVKTNIDQCQHFNGINGKMIARGQQTVRRLLNILRGQTAVPGLYTQSGTTRDENGNSFSVVEA